MNKKIITVLIITFLLILVPFMSGVATSGQTAKTPAASSSAITAEPAAGEFSVEQANRVDLALAQIAKKKRLTPLLRKITFSQDELNSYLNIIYTKQYAPQIKYIHMKLDKNNIVNGVLSIKLDAREYAQVPEFLRNINVDVSGKIESENSRMRYLFESLKINGANFSPNLLDQAFGAAQGNTKNKKSLFDWFDLLPGLKKLAVDTNQITIFY